MVPSPPFPLAHCPTWGTRAWGPRAAASSQHFCMGEISPSLSTQTPGLPRLPLQGSRARIVARPPAWLVGWWVGFSLPLPFLTGPASQIRNTPSSPLSKSLGTFQTLQTRPGGWVGITSPFLQARALAPRQGDGCSSTSPLLPMAGPAEVRTDWPKADCS